MRAGSRVTLVLFAAALAGTAWAAREWYDYYLQARDHDIPDQRWADCVKNVKEALRLRPASGTNVQTYGLQFVPYLPHYYIGVCLLEQQDYVGATEAFNLEEQQGAIRKTDLMEPFPRIRAYYQRCFARPAWERTLGLYAQRMGLSAEDIR